MDKIYLCAKEPYESKYQLVIKRCKNAGMKHYNNPKAAIEYSNTMDDVYHNINNYTPNRNRNILTVYDR